MKIIFVDFVFSKVKQFAFMNPNNFTCGDDLYAEENLITYPIHFSKGL